MGGGPHLTERGVLSCFPPLAGGAQPPEISLAAKTLSRFRTKEFDDNQVRISPPVVRAAHCVITERNRLAEALHSIKV